MLKKRSTKLLCLLIAFLWTTIVIGSSYAYFIDSVQVTGNVITTGNLKAEMQWSEDRENWQDADQGAIFSGDRWEPNYTDVKYIKVKNTGDLAFQYRLNIIPTLTEEHPGYKLGEVIDAYVEVVDDGYTEPAGYQDFADKTSSGTVASMIASDTGMYYGELLKADEEITLAVALHMQHTAGNEYMGLSVGDGFKLQLFATQAAFESDSFGSTYDEGASLPKNEFAGGSASGFVDVADGKTTQPVTLSGGAVEAQVPAGVKVNDGVTELTLTVKVQEKSPNGIKAGEGESLLSVDVHVDGLADDNTVPLKITMSQALSAGLNAGNTKLVHVENGQKLPMTQVESVDALSAHNQYYYAPATGTLTLNMATFSEVAVVADTVAKWEGTVATAFAGGSGTEEDPYIIANADQLAYMGSQVSNDNENYGKAHYKLTADVNIGGIENYNTDGRKVLWYPIGYNKVGGTTTDKGNWYTYGGSFKGVFDGAGHTISGIYQNTWAMVGDYSGTYYNDAMGLFGYVKGGTVKNLTIDNFYSEGEFAPTGCVTAYAADDATFENIAITNSHPQTYNTGVAGIVGWDKGEESEFTFMNITVDETNTISALWGSWDVAAAGLLGYLSPNSKAHLDNCHVSATIDVYNDVCGNYQYYWYRYCGAFIGTVDKRLDNGKGALDLSNVTATNCTINFGDRHEYYNCEFEKNTQASYTSWTRMATSLVLFNSPLVVT